MGRRIDRVGKQYSMLKVIRQVPSDSRRITYECLCECGNTTVVWGESLGSGNTKSCGCLRVAKTKERVTKRNYVHGLSTHKMYHIYTNARNRCTDKRRKEWPNYGGRGIEFRLGGLQDFIDMMYGAWREGYTLDRIDVNGHYDYSNIRWATMETQSRNRRHIRAYEWDGHLYSIRQMASLMGVAYSTAVTRLRKLSKGQPVGTTIQVKEVR